MTDLDPYTSSQYDAAILLALAIQAAGSTDGAAVQAAMFNVSRGKSVGATAYRGLPRWPTRSTRSTEARTSTTTARRGTRTSRRLRQRPERLHRVAGPGLGVRDARVHRGGPAMTIRAWIRLPPAILGAVALAAGCGAGTPVGGTFTVDFPTVADAVATEMVQVFVYPYSATATPGCEALFEARRTTQMSPPGSVAQTTTTSPCQELSQGSGTLSVGFGELLVPRGGADRQRRSVHRVRRPTGPSRTRTRSCPIPLTLESNTVEVPSHDLHVAHRLLAGQAVQVKVSGRALRAPHSAPLMRFALSGAPWGGTGRCPHDDRPRRRPPKPRPSRRPGWRRATTVRGAARRRRGAPRPGPGASTTALFGVVRLAHLEHGAVVLVEALDEVVEARLAEAGGRGHDHGHPVADGHRARREVAGDAPPVAEAHVGDHVGGIARRDAELRRVGRVDCGDDLEAGLHRLPAPVAARLEEGRRHRAGRGWDRARTPDPSRAAS